MLFILEQIPYLGEQLLLLAGSRRSGRGLVLLAVGKGVDALHEEEDAERDDEKLDDRLDEHAVVDGRRYGRIERIDRKRHLKVGKVHAAYQPTDGRHYYIRDDGGDNLTKGSSDNHADSHIYGVPLDGKLLEFLYKFAHSRIFTCFVEQK